MMMQKANSKRLRVFILAVCLLCALFFVTPQLASAEADTNAYTVVLGYSDDIQLRYQYFQDHKAKEVTGDVPLGGAYLNYGTVDQTLAIPQIYCVDAAVPFHSEVSSVSGKPPSQWYSPRTWNGWVIKNWFQIDEVPNYVAAAPEQIPAILGAHWRELEWIVMNGYQGKDSTGDDINHLTQMNSDFPLSEGTFGADVAVMATKAAIWHFTNPGIEYVSTNFLVKSIGNPASLNALKHRQFTALLEALIKGATAYASNPSASPITYDVSPYGIYIDPPTASPVVDPNNPAYLDPDNPAVPTYYNIYGPYYVRETFASVTGHSDVTNSTRGEVFLSMNIPGLDVTFYSDDPVTNPGSAVPLPYDGTIYGGAIQAPHVALNTQFYIRALPQTISAYEADGLAITALAKEEIKEVQNGTVKLPTVL
ncbi:MAG: thioester domain-containing protein, partial [Clostridiales bacterium]|nr:thioester domain-containing protein [Clostridiales bacterium]